MARALVATALAQTVVTLVALSAGEHLAPISSVYELLGLNGSSSRCFSDPRGCFATLRTSSAQVWGHRVSEPVPSGDTTATNHR